LDGPSNDDELHEYVLDELGIDVPRQAVCDGHVAPFTALADLHFERVHSAFWLGPRGGGKTFYGALAHLLAARFRPGYETLVAGATLEQAKRGYSHLLSFVRGDNEVDTSLKSETCWRNGSKVEVVAGSENAVRGPHPVRAHVDEVEMMQDSTFAASRLMATTKVIGGVEYQAQDLLTSTRAYAHSLVDKLIAECEQAEARGDDPPYRVYTWCAFETAQNVPGCGVDCGCEKIVRGEWENGSPRTFKEVCGGRLKRAQGWVPLRDLHRTFRNVSRAAWEAEVECTRPSTSHLILPDFAKDRHGVRRANFDPRDHACYMGVDFGGTDLHVAVWVAVLRFDIEALTRHGDKRVLRAGTRLVFDLAYRAEVGYSKFAQEVIAREARWRLLFPGFWITARWGDTQAKAARLDFRASGLDLRPATRDVVASIAETQGLVGDNLLAIDLDVGDLLVRQLEAWRFTPGTTKPYEGHDKSDDAADALRYALHGIKTVERVAAVNATATPAEAIPGGPKAGLSPRTESPYGDFGRDEVSDLPSAPNTDLLGLR
jgi:hypothetical protein